MTSDPARPDTTAGDFAARLRRLRGEAGLTQSDLASRAGVGVRTVRDLETGRASRPQRSTVELLAKALGLRDMALAEFFGAARGRIPGPRESAGAPAPRSLPAPLDLIGRDHEIGALTEHLRRDSGVTTLVGLAGVGKTVLAWAAAHRAQPYFAGGVCGITVVDVDSEADVLDSLAAVLGVPDKDAIPRRLQQPTLILVDCADHAGGAARSVIARLLASAPACRVIATGRGPLGLPGEKIWPVGPLDVPQPDATTLAEVRAAPAGELFLVRWTSQRGAGPDAFEVPAVAELVRRLGGLPLAIELAAARGRVLNPSEMLTRPVLDESVLREAIAVSYRLLTPAQQRVLRRLSVFQHRWSIELAEDLLGPAVDTVGVLDRLVELGLVSVRGSGALRFVLLGVVRDYARELAEAEGDLAPALRSHAEVFARYAARIAPQLMGPDLGIGVARLDDVNTDLWTALAHSAEDDPETALCLASKLPRWWRFRGRDVAGRSWLGRLLADPRCAGADPVVRSWAAVGLGQLANEHGAGAEEIPGVRDAVAFFHARGDVTGELSARNVLFALSIATGAFDEARQQGAEALALATRAGRLRDITVAQQNLTWHDIRVADLGAARRRLTEADRLAARTGESRLRVLIRCNLAEVLRLDGRFAEAVLVGRQAGALVAGVGDPGHHRRVLATIGQAQAQAGDLAGAERSLAELRAVVGEGPDADGPEDGNCAILEATIAFGRGERALAASWFAAAADAFTGHNDLRDVAEALVGLVASSDDPVESAQARERLDAVLDAGGLSLTARERTLIGG